MRLAAQIGIPVTEFWEITPYELNVWAMAYSKNKEFENKQNVFQAYLISRWVWAKNVNIKRILNSEKQEHKIMTDEEMLTQVKSLNKFFGGTVKEENNSCI